MPHATARWLAGKLTSRKHAVAALAALAAVFAAPAALAGDLHVTAKTLPCRDDSSIVVELHRRLPPSIHGPADFDLLLRGEPDGRVTILLESESVAMQRKLAVDARDCDALASAALLLVRDWLRDWPPLPPQPTRPTPDDALATYDPAQPVTPEPTARHDSWRIAALAGAFLSSSDLASGLAGSLTVVHRRPSGLLLEAGALFQSSVSVATGSGSVFVDLTRFKLAVGAGLLHSAIARLDASTGPTLCILTIRGHGFPADQDRRLLEFGWTAGLTASIKLSESFEWLSALDLDVRSRSDIIRIVDAGVDLAVAPVRASLFTGLAWALP